MELEELASRLGALETAEEDRRQAAALDSFMSQYGDRISGNQNLGLAILQELNNRGVQVPANDAVQQILDQLRMEAQSVLDMIRVQQQEQMQQNALAADMGAAVMDKINQMDKAVVAAQQGTAEGAIPPHDAPAPDAGAAPAPAPQAVPDAGMPPVPDMGAAPQIMPDAGMPPVPDMGAAPVPVQEPVPQGTLSDERLKNIRARLSDIRAKRSFKPASNKQADDPVKGFRLSENFIKGCKE